MMAPDTPIPQPPAMHPNEINAIYWQMFNTGQMYVGQLGGPAIFIDEWRERELAKLA